MTETSEPKAGSMKRRDVLKLGVAGAAGAVAAPAVARAQSGETIEWKMVMPWPKNAPGVGVGAQRIADAITAMSGGRLTVKVFAGGELVPPFGVFDAVSGGTAEIGHGTPYYWQGKDQTFHYFTGVPFGLTAPEHEGWLYYGGGQELWEKAYEPFGLVPFYAGNSGMQAGGWFRKPINSLDDLSGLKIRIAGLGGEVMRRIGATAVQLPPAEIFPSMQSGALDAAEWIGPWNDLAFGLYKVAKHYYMPAFHEFGAALEVMVNREAYAALPSDLQDIVRHAAMAGAAQTYADFTYHNIVSLKPLLEKEGVTLGAFSDDIVQALGKEADAVLAEVAATSDLAGEVNASFTAYRTAATEYAKASNAVVHSMRSTVVG